MTTLRQEQKYQMIKLIRSGRSLRESKSMAKAGAVALTSRYSRAKDRKDLESIEGTVDRLVRTRGDAKRLAAVRFGPRRDYPQKRNEFIASWVTDTGAINWKRDGNLLRKGPKNKSKPGSSQGKIGKTRVIGAARVARDLKALLKGLRKLGLSGERAKAIAGSVSKTISANVPKK